MFLGSFSLVRSSRWNLDHLDLVLYFMMGTRRTSIAVHYPPTPYFLPIHQSLNCPLYFHLSSFLYVHLLIIFDQGLYVVTILIHICTSPKGYTRYRMLPLCRSAELSYLLNLLTMPNYFTPVPPLLSQPAPVFSLLLIVHIRFLPVGP